MELNQLRDFATKRKKILANHWKSWKDRVRRSRKLKRKREVCWGRSKNWKVRWWHLPRNKEFQALKCNEQSHEFQKKKESEIVWTEKDGETYQSKRNSRYPRLLPDFAIAAPRLSTPVSVIFEFLRKCETWKMKKEKNVVSRSLSKKRKSWEVMTEGWRKKVE